MDCSFRKVVGTPCGNDSRYREQTVIPLTTCQRDISSHCRSIDVSDINTEVELILVRASIFTRRKDLSSWTICPGHRSSLGIGWRRASNRCRVPASMSTHSSKEKPRKANRGMNKAQSQAILKNTGIFVAVGSGICRDCRVIINTSMSSPPLQSSPTTSIDQITQGIGEITLTTTQSTPAPATPDGSFYIPPIDETMEVGFATDEHKPLLDLNQYYLSRDLSPVRSQLNTPLHKTSDRTKRYYIRKARQGVAAVVTNIAPNDASQLYQAVHSSNVIRKHMSSDDDCEQESEDMVLLQALADCYQAASNWETRRQILSIMADKVRYSTLLKFIPGLTRYRFTEAKRHCMIYGRGAPIQPSRSLRRDYSVSQVHHFITFITGSHIVQDLPFGERSVTLSNKDTLKLPNVIRMVIPERVVKQYLAYCEEVDFKALSRSTLLRILSVCPASTRKSLQGLDYVTSSGAQAFDDLEDVIETLGDAGKGMSWTKNTQCRLREAKRYLKSDYKVHVSENSTVPDHCRAYALSDSKTHAFQAKPCDHEHNDACDRCDDLVSTLKDIESALTDLSKEMAVGDKEKLTFTLTQSKKSIFAWKAHVLRYIHQDLARVDVLESLDDTSALVVQDWAMKYLPRKYRESQSDWFAKRGISWHISVAFRKENEDLQMLTMVHIIRSCNQDSNAVIAIMEDVVSQLKKAMPNLQTINYRQDNAGCYHSGPTILCVAQLGEKIGVKVKRLDFSDPQGGKGACDRKAAAIKTHMNSYVNSGNDIETPLQMYDAMVSSGGIPSLSVTLCESVTSPEMAPLKVDGVSTLYNIEYTKEGMRVWKAYDVGTGKLESKLNRTDNLPSLVITKTNPGEFSPTVVRRAPKDRNASVQNEEEERHVPTVESSSLFVCPEEGCVKTFMRHSSMIRHLDCGKHEHKLERETLFDKAVLEYSKQLEEGAAQPLEECGSVTTQYAHNNVERQEMGWALKTSGSSRSRFTEDQKSYLTAKFQIGEQTGMKLDPADVARSMMCAKGQDGNLLFTAEDFLTPKQITGFFSRLASKKSLPQNEQLHFVDIEEAVREARVEELVANVLGELVQKHPIVFDSYNLCELTSQKKLVNLSIQLLREICSGFNIDISDITVRRKKPYMDRLELLCKECECQV